MLLRLAAQALVSVLATTSALALTNDQAAPQLGAHRIHTHIELDGVLSEAEWQQATAASDFLQYQPAEGQPATEKTEVYILYNEANLYVGVRCFDSEPQRIVAQKLQRDSGLGDDDMFALAVDTYHDRRNAYFFATNPNGVEEDGQFVDGAFDIDLDWDGVWQVRAKIHDQGWSAEFRIPFWNLKFNSLPLQSWGVNFTRTIKRKTEQVNWASWSRDNGGGFLRISRAGDLLDLRDLKPGRNLQIKPYALDKSQRDDLLTATPKHDETFDAGLDAKYGLTSNLTLDLTVNTDFAQVEADVAQINLTRFPLFFPEKREFFLENASVYQFGEPGFFGPPPFLLFYSRRIGIEGNDQIVPIIAGGRLTGKVGDFEVGLLNILTDEKSDFSKSNFSVLRVNRDVFQRSKVGVMLTNRANIGQNSQQAYGVDANLWLSNPLAFQPFFAQTHDSKNGQDRRAWKLGLDFTKDHWGWFASHMRIDKEFDPAIGFVLRPDVRRTVLTFRVSPQPNGRVLRRTNVFQTFTHIDNREGRLQDWNYQLTFFNELSSGDNLNFGAGRIFERLDQPFHFRPDLLILPGDYRNNSLQVDFASSTKRKLVASGIVFWREFYDGELFNWGGGLGYGPNAHLSFRLSYDRNNIDLPQGKLNTDLFAFRLNMALNTRLFLNTLLQYNSETNELSTNARLNFIHSPGSDLFLVYNESRSHEGGNFLDNLPARNRELILKFTRLFRF
ncbi:MAG: DUF5916 domain-containing protein [bacterium]